jgi:hypothetical protein
MKNAIYVMFMVFAIFAMVGAFILGTYYASQKASTTRSTSDDAVRNLNLQKTCAEGAAAYYKTENIQPKLGEIDSYLNHFDPKRGKCFVLTILNEYSGGSDGKSTTLYETLVDGFEGTSYGDFDLFQKVGDTQIGKPIACRMRADGVHQSFCNSRAEWENYVATFGIVAN